MSGSDIASIVLGSIGTAVDIAKAGVQLKNSLEKKD